MRFLLFMICVSFSLSGYGQITKIGFRGGPSFSNFYDHSSPGELPGLSVQTGEPNQPLITGPDGNDSPPRYYYSPDFVKDIRIGFYSYLFLEIDIRERLSLELGLGYSQKGIDMKYNYYATTTNADNSTTDLTYQFNRNLRLDYIVVPATFQYMLDRKQRLYVLGGVYNAFAVNFLIKNSLVTSNEKTYNPAGQLTYETDARAVEETTYAKIFDAGLVGGFGVNVPLTEKIKIGLDIRTALGLINIPGKHEKHGFQSFSERTKNLSFETGVRLQYDLGE